MNKEKGGSKFRGISARAQVNHKLLFFLIFILVAAAIAVVAFILFGGNKDKSGFYADSDGDGIINGNDPDANGDGIMENFGGSGGSGGGGSSGSGGSPTVAPGGDIDNDGIPNINDPDIDGDGIPNGNDPDPDGDGIIENPPVNPPSGNDTTPTIDEQSCENFRASRGMDGGYFSLIFTESGCSALASQTCNYGDAFLANYIWNENLKCCVWKCSF